jgi:nucleoside-diphosphate-sugar epimerase
MRVLITGSSGFFMGAFVRQLGNDSRCRHITLFDQNLTDSPVLEHLAARGKAPTAIVGDIRDRRLLRRCVVDGQIDTIVHAAALTHDPARERTRPADYYEVNLMGTVSLLDAVREAGAPLRRFVAISSCAVYGAGVHGLNPVSEGSATLPEDIYGASKLATEEAVRRYGELYELPYVILRPGKLFGATEHPTDARTIMSAPYQLATAWRRGTPLRTTRRTMTAALDWLNADDAARALRAVAAGQGCNGAVYNVGSGHRTPFADLVATMEASTGARLVKEVADSDAADLDIDPARCWGEDAASDITLARSQLGGNHALSMTKSTRMWSSSGEPTNSRHPP